jgi:hypothetical protein
MRGEIQNFIHYLQTVKNAAANTVVSYERDLREMSAYMAEQGIFTADKVTSTILNAYVLYLEESGMSTATISRTIATLRRFFDYQCKHGSCNQDPSELLKAPKVERKPTHVVTEEELQQTAAVIREVGFAKIHVFPYSQREGTKAAVMPGQLPKAEKERRARLLIAIGEETAAAYQQQWLGRESTVLLEEKHGDVWLGYTPEYIPVTLPDCPGCRQGAILPIRLAHLSESGMTAERL